MIWGMILTFSLIVIAFTGVLFWKLTDPKWYYQFVAQNFTDRDLFTRLVKWLMS